jgi:hypothetical protein
VIVIKIKWVIMEMGGHRKGMIMDNDGKGSYRETEKEKKDKRDFGRLDGR